MPRTQVRDRRRYGRICVVGAVAPVFAVGTSLTSATAQEGEGDFSRSAARFLSGEILNVDLDNVAELAGVEAINDGEDETVFDANPLNLEVLNTIEIDIPGGLQVPLSDFVELGAVNQWAAADPGAESHAATGAVADNGGVGTGVDDAGSTPA
jgi:hypothetical protein